MSRGGILSAALMLVACTVQAGTETAQVQSWLEKMAVAIRTLNYEGTFVRVHGDQLEGMHVVHRVADGREQERLVSLNGAAREVRRDANSVTCILPDEQRISVDRRGTTRGIGRRFPGDPSQYADSYRLEVIGDARMTGRLAKVVAIVPNDTLRYGYRLYLDLETGLPLKSDVMGEDGNPVEQLMFTSLRVADDIDPVQLEPVLQGRLYTLVHKSTAAKPASSGETRWRIGKLPPGFELTAADRRQAEQGKGELEHFVFSDGIASVSIYVERADPETAFRGAYRMGAIHAFARELEGHQITAVGEVPAETVRMMAESVTRTGGGSP